MSIQFKEGGKPIEAYTCKQPSLTDLYSHRQRRGLQDHHRASKPRRFHVHAPHCASKRRRILSLGDGLGHQGYHRLLGSGISTVAVYKACLESCRGARDAPSRP